MLEQDNISIKFADDFLYTRLVYNDCTHDFYIEHDIIGGCIYPTLTIVERKTFKSKTYSQFSYEKVPENLNDLIKELFEMYEVGIIMPHMVSDAEQYKYENCIKFWS